MRRLLLRMLVLWATAGIARAQTAALSGAVYDPSHAGIFNAAVTLINSDTGSARTTYTSADGLYSFALLAPGSYSVTVEARGARFRSTWPNRRDWTFR